VLIAEAALYDAQNIIITAKVLDVETGGVANSAPPAWAGKDPEKMQAACVTLAQKLLGKRPSSSSYPSNSSYSSSYTSSGQDFTETAWDINMKMIWVEGGEFMMGCTSEQSDCESDEENVRRVTVDGFYIGMLEVTQSQWEKVVGTKIYTQKSKAGASYTYGVGPDYPMYYVSWDEAMEFCRLLSNKTGKTYTLPTEAQWEYAARGGKRADGTKYAGSNMVDVVAWYTDNSGGSTHPCGTKRANALGLYDMSGNVMEWCKDWYSNSYISYDTNNPAGPSSGSYRVYRGGGWNSNARGCRVADRDRSSPGLRYYPLGFRVVCLP
jgi:formylglycine-generating enzyme required for sulfatase activity